MINRDNYWLSYADFAIEELKGYTNPTVLKTDLWNEAYDYPKGGIISVMKGNIFGIEYDKDIFNKAKAKLNNKYSLVFGDIRKLPFADNIFDVIFDFSTLDHIKNYEGGLKEYKRALKPSGKLLVVVWTTEEKDTGNLGDWKPTDQYYFNFDNFSLIFNSLFKEIKKEFLFNGSLPQKLYKFVGLKKYDVGISL